MMSQVGTNLRLARSQMDRLEADLWTWRSKCKASGKKIPKRLVQARAKWAFQKQGIADFKVSVFAISGPTFLFSTS